MQIVESCQYYIDLLKLPEGSIVCDIGAGTGNYSNALADSGYQIKAVEPSMVMREQAKPNKAVEWFSGTADSIPLKDRSVDGIISTFAVQHFPDISAAASEMWRVCGDNSIIILTVDPRKGEHFWLHDYFPVVHKQLLDMFIPLDDLIASFTENHNGSVSIVDFPIPHDISDLITHAGWGRPEIYLDHEVRRGISPFALADQNEIQKGLNKLKTDLQSGKWDIQNGDLRNRKIYNLGFKFLKFSRSVS
jgi:ubiquinone/menaquinone biosynthesis C-methylase UbiE